MNPDALALRLVDYFETGVAPPGLFTDDVFLDFTLPRWRVQARGLAGVLAVRRNGHPCPGKVPRWRAAAVPGGCVMEWEERWTDENGAWYCREMLWAELRGGSICRLSVYCTGDWDEARQAAHREQVHLLEP